MNAKGAGGAIPRSETVTVHLKPALRAAVDEDRERRGRLTLDKWMEDVLDAYFAELRHAHGLQPRPTPPPAPDRSLTIVREERRVRWSMA